MAKKNRYLDEETTKRFIALLKNRFQDNPARHQGISWSVLEKRLNAQTEKLWSLHQMETTGGEPDVIGKDESTGEFLYVDCAPESPDGRRSFCYDEKALHARKANKPASSAENMADTMGVEILNEAMYFELQSVQRCDTKTSSWLQTPSEVRDLGGAIFGDWRFGRVFIYHNGADSYYAARGFRAVVRL